MKTYDRSYAETQRRIPQRHIGMCDRREARKGKVKNALCKSNNQPVDSCKHLKDALHKIENHGENIYCRPIYGLKLKKQVKYDRCRLKNG